MLFAGSGVWLHQREKRSFTFKVICSLLIINSKILKDAPPPDGNKSGAKRSEKAAFSAGKFPESGFETVGIFIFDFSAEGDRCIKFFRLYDKTVDIEKAFC